MTQGANANKSIINSDGVDQDDFSGIAGGALQQDILAFACMICHSFVLSQGEGIGARQRLLDVIAAPDIPAAPQQLAATA